MQVLPPEQFTYREIDWDRDAEELANFDASFATATVYRLIPEKLGARFIEEKLPNCVQKRYDTSGVHAAVRESEFSILAEADGRIAAFMTVRFESWNRRAWISHLYVLPGYKKRGVGKYFVQRAREFAVGIGARGLWLETQNYNYPAIQFYLAHGFSFRGFDSDLYDPAVVPGETALYFGMDI
jgi:GNAT superfamily N-acetyltransferase